MQGNEQGSLYSEMGIKGARRQGWEEGRKQVLARRRNGGDRPRPSRQGERRHVGPWE